MDAVHRPLARCALVDAIPESWPKSGLEKQAPKKQAPAQVSSNRKNEIVRWPDAVSRRRHAWPRASPRSLSGRHLSPYHMGPQLLAPFGSWIGRRGLWA